MRWLIVPCLLVLVGCGPLMLPMVHRINSEEQRKVDEVWNNMLTPPDRVDRDILLDVVMLKHLFEIGVDRLLMTSEKQVGNTRVKMTVRFERAHPERDKFEIELLNRWGFRMRRERYTREEVESRTDLVVKWHAGPSNGTPATQEWEKQIERRMQRVEAATRLNGERR